MGERAKVKPKTTHDLQIETLRPARDAGRDGCPSNWSNVSHCTGGVVWCGVVAGDKFTAVQFSATNHQAELWLPTRATWLHEGCNCNCQNEDPGENMSVMHKSYARPSSQQFIKHAA